MMTRAELQTARLTLRPVAPKDEGVVVASLNDIAVSGWLAVVPYPYFPADFQYFLREYAVPGDTFVVEDGQGFVGIVGVEGRALGYWLTPQRHGFGYATEAARAVLAEHFTQDPADIASGYYEGNTRSANVLRKLGFVETGRGTKHCRALRIDRAHVDMQLTRDAFTAVLPIKARSERLAYRHLQPTDLDALQVIVSQWEVVRQLGSFPWPPEPEFTRLRARPYLGDGFAWGVLLQGVLIGTVAVTEGELGYMIDPAYHRQSYAFEACQTALKRAFGALALAEVQAGVWADNAASQGLLAKLGFRIVAETLDHSIARGAKAAGYDLQLLRADWSGA